MTILKKFNAAALSTGLKGVAGQVIMNWRYAAGVPLGKVAGRRSQNKQAPRPGDVEGLG